MGKIEKIDFLIEPSVVIHTEMTPSMLFMHIFILLRANYSYSIILSCCPAAPERMLLAQLVQSTPLNSLPFNAQYPT